MAFGLTALLDPTVLFGAGGGGSLLAFIGAKFHRLDTEVKECRQRDADVLVMIAGVRVLAGKIQKDEPDCVELRMFNDLCARRLGPPPKTPSDFEALLDRIDQADKSRKR